MPMLYGRVFYILFQRADIVLIGIILGPESVGLYAVAHTTAGLISVGIGAVVALARPTVASLYHQDRREDLQSTLSILANLTFWPCTILVAGLIWYGDLVLHLFGERYVVSHTVLGVLAVGRLLNVAGGLVGVLLNMTGHQTMVARVYGWSAGINATLNLIGIYYFGIIGAAVVTALTVVFWNIWLNIYCVRQTNFHPSILFPFYRKLLASGDSLK